VFVSGRVKIASPKYNTLCLARLKFKRIGRK